jgi:hypothetical protein
MSTHFAFFAAALGLAALLCDSACTVASPGRFGCGSSSCATASEYCYQTIETTAQQSCASTFTCVPIPAACAAVPTCACVSQSISGQFPPGGINCNGDAERGLYVLYAPSC